MKRWFLAALVGCVIALALHATDASAQGVIDFETWLRYLEEPSSAASSNRADSLIHMTVADSSPADRRRNAPGGPRNRLPPNREYEQAPRRMSDQTPVPALRSAR